MRAVGVDLEGLLTGGSEELGVAGADFFAVGGDDFLDDGGDGRFDVWGDGRLGTGGDGPGGLSVLGSESGSGGDVAGVAGFSAAGPIEVRRAPIEAGVFGVPPASFTGFFTLPGDLGDLTIPPCAPCRLFAAAGVLAGPLAGVLAAVGLGRVGAGPLIFSSSFFSAFLSARSTNSLAGGVVLTSPQDMGSTFSLAILAHRIRSIYLTLASPLGSIHASPAVNRLFSDSDTSGAILCTICRSCSISSQPHSSTSKLAKILFADIMLLNMYDFSLSKTSGVSDRPGATSGCGLRLFLSLHSCIALTRPSYEAPAHWTSERTTSRYFRCAFETAVVPTISSMNPASSSSDSLPRFPASCASHTSRSRLLCFFRNASMRATRSTDETPGASAST